MFDIVEDLYVHSGAWADPIVVTAGLLFIAGWIMMFTVRMVKRFILFTVIALVLPNAIGFVGYIETADSFHEAVVERGVEMGEEVKEAAEDMEFSPLYLGLLSSLAAGAVGIGGIVRAGKRSRRVSA